MKIVIIGGVAGGASAAARLRRLSESAEIKVFERSRHMSYANCGLPYFIADVIKEEKKLYVQTPEDFKERFNVDVFVRHEVTKILPEKKQVEVKNLETGEVFFEDYDKLIISAGAKPIKPAIEGINSEKVMTLRTVEDAVKIKSFIDENKPESVIIAGGGFIGVELAEGLIERGLKVKIIQRPKQLLKNLDPDMAAYVHAEFRHHGAELMLGKEVVGFEEKENSIVCKLKDGESVEGDFAIFALGVSPDTGFALDAGLKMGVKRTIAVDANMKSSIEDIYAVGDCVEVLHLISGKMVNIPLAGPANKQGRIVADNICGIESEYRGSMGSSIAKVFELAAASTGLNSATASDLGLDFYSIVLSPLSSSSYYPGYSNLVMKLIIERGTERILGAQVIGEKGADKRLDVLATAMLAGLKGSQLKELELCYAPPFSSAKDPCNMAGFMIENIESGLVDIIDYEGFEKLEQRENYFFLDVRTEREFARGHVEGFSNIPVDELRERISELPKDKKIIVICLSGVRSYIACRTLNQNGFKSANFSGGFAHYRAISNDDSLRDEIIYPCGMPQ